MYSAKHPAPCLRILCSSLQPSQLQDMANLLTCADVMSSMLRMTMAAHYPTIAVSQASIMQQMQPLAQISPMWCKHLHAGCLVAYL